jgi:hypothetical protein
VTGRGLIKTHKFDHGTLNFHRLDPNTAILETALVPPDHAELNVTLKLDSLLIFVLVCILIDPYTMVFLDGNTDVVTRILGFVAETSEDLNTCAMISRVFRLSRNDPRFDQTRTGTIILKAPPANITPEVWQRWDQQVFKGNRVRLVVILAQLPYYETYSAYDFPFPLSNVREVVLRCDLSIEVPDTLDERQRSGSASVSFFKNIIPNLDILDIGALSTDLGLLEIPIIALYNLRASVFRCTGEGVYRGCHFCLLQPYPVPVNNNMNSLRDIHLDPFGAHLHQKFSPNRCVLP